MKYKKYIFERREKKRILIFKKPKPVGRSYEDRFFICKIKKEESYNKRIKGTFKQKKGQVWKVQSGDKALVYKEWF